MSPFLAFLFSPWTWRNDQLDVTVGINARISTLKRQKKTPKLIRLGGWASEQFLMDHGLDVNKPPDPGAFVYAGLPVYFNDDKVIGIYVES